MMKVFDAFNTNNSSKDADTFAPSCSSAKNTEIVVDTVVAVSILLFAILSIILISGLLLNAIIIAVLLIGITSKLKKQTLKFLYLV